MYTIELAEQVTLFFVVAYYASHCRHRVRTIWAKMLVKIASLKRFPKEQVRNLRMSIATVIALFTLQGCVEVSPLILYSLHIGQGLVA